MFSSEKCNVNNKSFITLTLDFIGLVVYKTLTQVFILIYNSKKNYMEHTQLLKLDQFNNVEVNVN